MHSQRPYFKISAVLSEIWPTKSHPMIKQIGYGSLASLSRVDVGKQAKSFYDRFYRADRMTVVTLFDNKLVDYEAIASTLSDFSKSMSDP